MGILNHINAYHVTVKNFMNSLIENLEKYDSEIRDVLKVFYYECLEQIKPNNDDAESLDRYFDFINNFNSFYRIIRIGIQSDKLAEYWVPEMINQVYVPEPIGRSLKVGVLHIQNKKEPLLTKLIELYKQLIHLATITNRTVNGEDLFNQEISPKSNDLSYNQLKTIDKACYNKKRENVDDCREFLKRYAILYRENEKIKNTDAIKRCYDDGFEGAITDRTLNDWIKDYKENL